LGIGDLFRRFRGQPAAVVAEGSDLFDEDFLRRLNSLALASRRAFAGQRRGERRGKKRGSGVAFADHRAYVPGDDIRFLDVASYERLGKLLIRLYEEDEDRSLFVLLDCSASMGFGDGAKMRLGRRLAAALGYVGLVGLDRVSVVGLSDGRGVRLPPTRGKQRIFRLLRFLDGLRAEGTTDLAAALVPFALREKRRGVAVLITDLFDPHGFQAGIDVLRFNRFEPCVIQLFDEREAAVDLWGDVRAVDVETGEGLDVTVTTSVLEGLAQRNGERRQEAARYCVARGVPFFAVSVQQPFDEVVLGVLRRGGLLG